MPVGKRVRGKILRLILVMAVAAGTLALADPTQPIAEAHFGVAKARKCRDVGHVPYSDILSYNIRVHRIKCGRVRRWIRRGEGSWEEIPDRFKCRYKRVRPRIGIPYMAFKCVLPRWEKKFAWSATWRISPWR